jgi:hypothetical protein
LDEEIQRREQVLHGELVNSAGALVHVSFNNSQRDGHRAGFTFYCGRKVGRNGYANPCLSCDGTCGPTNGCQCLDCHNLDERLKALSSSRR